MKLIEERDNLKEMWRDSLTDQSNLQIQNDKYRGIIKQLEKSLGALTCPNPAFAVQKLQEEQDPQFMYSCKSKEDKKLLLEFAIKTQIPDIIVTVLHFLKSSLTPTLFDSLLFPCPEAVTCYLRFLVETETKSSRVEWRRITFATSRYDELALYLYATALKQNHPEKRLGKFQECLRFIKQYSCLTHYIGELEGWIIDLSLKALPLSNHISPKSSMRMKAVPSQEMHHVNDK